jgi:catalase
MAKSSKRVNSKSAAIHDQKLDRGEGGELHQVAEGDVTVLTTAQGGPVSDDQNSLKIGPRGPTLIEDFHFREKIFHFDHERIPERVVHARGYGAHGFFENYKPLSKYTRADLFQAQSAHDNFWDFISLTPESMHMIMWVMSDRAIPRSLRFMEGFGVHTFRLVNAKNESTFVKFHWKPKLGLQSVLWNEAVKINGADPDFHRRDLWTAIQSGNFPEWELQFQLFDQAFADSFDFDILDPTKLIPEEILPPIPVGRLVLDRMPENFFAETEQVAFMTQNVPPGVDFSNDPLLQGRNFSYLDTQLKRLGSPNFTHIPINAPKCPFHHFQQDGHMAMRNPVGRANYQPNSFGDSPRESPERGFTPFADVENGAKRRLRAESFADHYSQARQFFISQTRGEQHHIAAALTFELSKVKLPVIRERMVSHLLNIDETLANKVGTALGLKKMPKPADAAMPTRQDLEALPTLSIVEKGPQRFEGRKLGILITDGTDATMLKALQAALAKQGATFEIIAPKVGGAKASDGSWIEADQMIDGGPSVLYDAIALLPAAAAMDGLVQESTARDFVADAFAHCKFIGYADAVIPLFEKAGIAENLDEGCVLLKSAKDIAGFVDTLGKLRLWGRESTVKLC